MRNALLFSLLVALTVSVSAQTPPSQNAAPAKPGAQAPTAKPAPAPPPPTTKPAAAAPAGQTPAAQTPPARSGQAPTSKPAAAATGRGTQNSRTGVALTVTDMRGTTLSGVHVELSGATPRMGETDASGQINFTGLQAGTYRLTFSGDTVTSFEREVALKAGVNTFDISLRPAPPPKEVEKIVEVAAPAPPPQAPVLGPLGMTQAMSLYDLAEKELKAKSPRREILVACSGNLRSTVVFLTQPEPLQRKYEGAEATYYVLGGEANVNVDGKEGGFAAGGYIATPRGAVISIARRGNKPLTLLTVLSGEPCEEAK